MENAQKLIEQLYLSQQYDLALSKAQEIVEQVPQHFKIWTIIGLIYIRQKNYLKGIEILLKSLQISENQLLAYKNLGYAYSQLRQHDLAIQHLIKVLDYEPANTLIYYQLANISIDQKKYNQALHYLNKGLRYDQNNIRIYLTKAQCFHQMKKFDLAIRIYQIVIKLDPKSGEAYRNMGQAYSRLFNVQLALQCYGRAISINPNDIDAYWLQGKNFQHQNLLYMANVNFDKVLQLNYKHQEALECYTSIQFSGHVYTIREEYRKLGIPQKMQQYRQARRLDLVDYFHALFYTLSHFINGYLNLDLSRTDTKYQKICAMLQNYIKIFHIIREQIEPLIAVFYDELEDILQMNEKQIKEKLGKWLKEDYLKKYKLIELNEVLAELCLEKSINKQDFTLNKQINFKSLTQHIRYRLISSQVAFCDALDIIIQILQ